MSTSLDDLIDRLAAGVWPDAAPALDPDFDAARFWDVLGRFDGPRASTPDPRARIELYHLLVQRHAAGGAVALRWHDSRAWCELGYIELDVRARRRAAAWASLGAAPGALAAIYMPFGVEAVVSICAALCLGLRIAVVAPSGRLVDARRLAALGPAFVVGGAPGASVATSARALPLVDAPAGVADAFAYGAAEPVVVALTPLDDPPAGLSPIAVTAEQVWRGALRDGLVVFALRPGDRVVAPGIDPARAQPALVFTTLLRGATYLHVDPEILAGDPSVLATEPLRAAILGAAARDALIDPRAGLLRIEHWLRDPLERHDPAAWQRFVERHRLRGARHSNLVLDPASGGAILWAPRPAGQTDTGVVPAPGLAWSLVDAEHDLPATGAVGRLALGKRPPAILLARHADGFYIAGTASPRRAGDAIPPELAASPAAAGLARGASVVAVAGRDAIERDLVLLVFTGADRAAAADPARVEAIRRQLVGDVGPAWIPDRIVVVPHHPRRRSDGSIDDAWCRDQLIGGALFAKVASPLFGHLTELRDRAAAPEHA